MHNRPTVMAHPVGQRVDHEPLVGFPAAQSGNRAEGRWRLSVKSCRKQQLASNQDKKTPLLECKDCVYSAGYHNHLAQKDTNINF